MDYASNPRAKAGTAIPVNYKYGRLAEWLGSGLQNRVRRFESATDLHIFLTDSFYSFVNF
ncbi:MAG: hypothetical protein JG782_353 [Anaerophaga sp.]|nr:hypothetical protein [Anaerophaga sp.]